MNTGYIPKSNYASLQSKATVFTITIRRHRFLEDKRAQRANRYPLYRSDALKRVKYDDM